LLTSGEQQTKECHRAWRLTSKEELLMSNRQNTWDDMRIRNRVSPREVAEDNAEKMQQQEADENQPLQEEDWIPPGNADQGSRKK
jgi:hypothetical protein